MTLLILANNDVYNFLVSIRKLGQVHELAQPIRFKSIDLEGSFENTIIEEGKLGVGTN